MSYLTDANTIISIICGLITIVMFILAKIQKDKCEAIKKDCIKINTGIEQKIEILNKTSTITSSDQFNIEKVKTFDNRKSID